jgi:hypothetical protein
MSASGRAGTHRWRKRNGPPEDQAWVWFTREMMESPAWRAMTGPARQVLDRVVIEHMGHGGTENGQLPVTHKDFEVFGVRKRSVKQGIAIAVALGWLDVTRQGYAFGTLKVASEYGLTFLPRTSGASASNRWKVIKADEAKSIVKAIIENRKPISRKRAETVRRKARGAAESASRSQGIPRQDIDRRGESAPDNVLSFPSEPAVNQGRKCP